jgi:hypothetical protein
MMANSRIALTLSVLLLVAVPTSHSAHGQATPTTKNNWCGGSVPTGIANSGSKFTVKVFALVSTDIYGQFHHERPVGGAKVVLLTQSKVQQETSTVTDACGLAEFSEVPSGTYTVHIEGARFWESQATLTVNAMTGSPTEIRLIWPLTDANRPYRNFAPFVRQTCKRKAQTSAKVIVHQLTTVAHL